MLTLGRKTLSVPILQGGMGVGVSLGGLAGAVAACGGMGCISSARWLARTGSRAKSGSR